MLRLFRDMVLLRRFEEAAQIACRKGETPGFLHLYIGQEATAVGVCAHLRPADWVTSTHRGHGHALAKGSDPGQVMAELFGRANGICGGRGGTMHLYDRAVGLFGTNGVVGAGIGHAVGIGMGAAHRGSDEIAVAFFGDGAVNHGAFHEGLNLAAVQRAQTVFVCENNLYATATPLRTITLNPEVATKAASYGMPGVAVDGNDVFAMYLAMQEAAARARAGEGPTLIEAKTYRHRGHSRTDPAKYRPEAELAEWLARDPIKLFAAALVASGTAAQHELDAIHEAAREEARAAAAEAAQSPWPEARDFTPETFAAPTGNA